MISSKLKLACGSLAVLAAASAVVVSRATVQKPQEPSRTNAGAAAGPAALSDPVALADDATDLAMLDRAWADAIPRRDIAVVNRILADDFTGVDPAGNIFTKAKYVSDLSGGAFSNDDRIQLDEVRARMFGDTAVVTSLIKLDGAPTGGRMTNVYVRRQGRWRCVNSHASGRTEPYGVIPAPGFGPETIRVAHPTTSIIRLWYPCRVEQVFVKAGQTVKHGDRLLSFRSERMATAKNRLHQATEEFKRIAKSLDELSRQNRAAHSKEREKLEQAQARLNDQAQQDSAILHAMGDIGNNAWISRDKGDDSRLRIHSGASGTITRVAAAPATDYNENSMLIVIESPPGVKLQVR